MTVPVGGGSCTPEPPASISVAPTNSSDGRFTVSWAASPSACANSYQLEESYNQGTWQSVPLSDAQNQRSWSPSPPKTASGTYAYHVRACNGTNNCSADRVGAQVTVSLPVGALDAPANLFIAVTRTPSGALEERVQILDFGIARLVGPSAAERFGPFFPDDDPIAPELDSEVTGEHRICGTPEYMAPEQILGGPPDVRSDFYALGVILHRLVGGQLPFRARSRYELYHRHLHEPPPPFPVHLPVPIPFSAAVHRALSKEARDRFPSAAEMRAVLRESVGLPPVKRPRLFPTEVEPRPIVDPQPLGLGTVSISPLPAVPPTPSAAPPSPRRRWLYSAVSVAAVIAAIVAYLTLSGSESPATTGTAEITAGTRP